MTVKGILASNKPLASNQLATHVEALRAAGFAEIGTLWQRGDNRLLCGVRPADRAREGEVSRQTTA